MCKNGETRLWCAQPPSEDGAAERASARSVSRRRPYVTRSLSVSVVTVVWQKTGPPFKEKNAKEKTQAMAKEKSAAEGAKKEKEAAAKQAAATCVKPAEIS